MRGSSLSDDHTCCQFSFQISKHLIIIVLLNEILFEIVVFSNLTENIIRLSLELYLANL